jgi:hypothetical protein
MIRLTNLIYLKENTVLSIKFTKVLLLIGLSIILAIIPAIMNAGAAVGKTSKVVFAVE